jgi:hypothetical protein
MCFCSKKMAFRYGRRNFNEALTRLKHAQIKIFRPSLQSPDFSLIEAVWLTINQRLCGGGWRAGTEFKDGNWVRMAPNTVISD